MLLLALPLLAAPSLRAADVDEVSAVPVVLTDVQSTSFTLTGHVFDEKDQPLMGARVSLVENTSKGSMTDIDGAFRITGVKVGQTIEIAFVGYKTQRIKLESTKALTIKLAPDSELLDEVVVTAFGAGQKKASIVGSVQTVRPKELKVPAANLSSSFAGRLAGVVSINRSGAPGADGSDFWIRGISSVNASSPLIVLDGVQISAGDLNTLDPEIIEGFSILKDATATALYGSRGANGVVIITTKTGEDMPKPKINVRTEAYVNMPTSVPKFVDAVSYMRLYNEALSNYSTGSAPYSQDRIEGTAKGLDPYAFPNVDWYGELFRNYTFNQKANLNLRGGGKRMNYFMSVTADHQTGLLKPRSKEVADFDNSEEFFRYSFQNNIQVNLHELTKLSLRLNAQITNTHGPYNGVNTIFGQVMNANPVDFPISYPDDEAIAHTRWGSRALGAAIMPNPFVTATNGYQDGFKSTIIANIELDQDLKFITPGLKLNTLVSFKNWSTTTTSRSRNSNFYELESYQLNPEGGYDLNFRRHGDEVNTNLNSGGGSSGDRWMYFHAMLLWNREFDDHSLGAMFNYNQDEFTFNNAGSNLLHNLPKRKQGIAGRLTYSYANRYIAEANFGYNGSENFAKGHRFGFFPSVALGYVISEESFWEPIKDYVNLLKLRGSYGLVGNDNIGGDRFVYMSDISLQGGKSYTTGLNQNYGLTGPSYNRFENPDITWEVGYKLNVGLDLQLAQHFKLNVDAFKERRTNIFQQRGTVPTYMGTASTKIFGNLAEVTNYGIDGSAEYSQQFNKDFWMMVRGTFTYAHNTITKWDEPAFFEYPQRSMVGRSLSTHFGYVADRLFIDEADVQHSPDQSSFAGGAAPGDIKYVDQPNINGEYDGRITADDQKSIGFPTVPEIIYGFGCNLGYKNLDFGIFFQGAGNTSLHLNGFHPFGKQNNRNVLQFVADNRWSPTNQDPYAKYPRLTQNDRPVNTATSTFWLRDASFLKLKNVELGYTINNWRIYVSGVNLLTFSKFKLWDPERGGGNGLGYPTMRTVNFGVQVSFN